MSSRTLPLVTLLLIGSTQVVLGEAPWLTLPPTPPGIAEAQTGYDQLNGVRLYYAIAGEGSPVVLLHSGLANSDWWGNQVRALAAHHRVVLLDSRGHGRSGRDDRPFSYDLMADDVVALLDKLDIPKADVVGWSDGAIVGLDLAIRHPGRVAKVFAFGANTSPDGLISGAGRTPTFTAYFARVAQEYAKLSSTPREFYAFLSQIGRMWDTEPNWTDAQLQSIKSSVWVVVGDHEEAIKRSHAEYMAAAIPNAGLLVLPGVGHFAPLQDPDMFTAAIIHFLDDD